MSASRLVYASATSRSLWTMTPVSLLACRIEPTTWSTFCTGPSRPSQRNAGTSASLRLPA